LAGVEEDRHEHKMKAGMILRKSSDVTETPTSRF
jgi:hypothetical protein